ncbi:unnamed protein product [Nezara viridula]|uniref:Transcription elongation factor SPT4 n=1 Tax=Nezara viridula TaxID=85310 RepID=A0A9P0HBI3_NEZVI|nr:unnamed protein product [Nezara viridula]
MKASILPRELRGCRACLSCSLIKTFDQFEQEGCENCEQFLHLKKNRDNVHDCTSANFDGFIGMSCPEDSWVAKWQRMTTFVPGVYAISVAGTLPPHIIREMKKKDRVYRSRDTSLR